MTQLSEDYMPLSDAALGNKKKLAYNIAGREAGDTITRLVDDLFYWKQRAEAAERFRVMRK